MREMLEKEIIELYKKFRLLHYRSMFSRIRERDGSLSATEAYAVDVIYLLGDPTLGQFADCLGLSQPNATYKVNNLIAKGYVVKAVSDTDRRECRLGVTDKFFSYYNTQREFISRAAGELEREFSPEELESFEKMLRALSDTMK